MCDRSGRFFRQGATRESNNSWSDTGDKTFNLTHKNYIVSLLVGIIIINKKLVHHNNIANMLGSGIRKQGTVCPCLIV